MRFNGNKIKQLRKKEKITLENLRYELKNKYEIDTSVTSIVNWQKNKFEPNSSTLFCMAKLFNVQMEYFFN